MDTKKLYGLYLNAQIIKRIRIIRNICLSTGAYSNHNLELQLDKLERNKTPQWEIDIVAKSYDIQRKLSHQTLKELEELLNDAETNL